MSSNQLALFYESTYGAMYFATLMSTTLYGMACVQTFFYYVHYQSDPLHTKILVAILWALDTTHEALTISGAYKSTMAGLLSSPIVTGSSELYLLYILTALVAVPTQGFFVYRIYIFSRKNIIAPLIWAVLALVQLVCPIIYVAETLHSMTGSDSDSKTLSPAVRSIPTFYFSVAAGVDILIAIFMTVLLHKRTTTDFPSTVHLLQRLTVFAVNTGTWTATFALLSVILLHVFPSNIIYAIFAIVICSVYYNTLLANLNARAYLRGEDMRHGVNMGFLGGSGLRVTKGGKNETQHGQANLASNAHQGVWKTVEVVTVSDGLPQRGDLQTVWVC